MRLGLPGHEQPIVHTSVTFFPYLVVNGRTPSPDFSDGLHSKNSILSKKKGFFGNSEPQKSGEKIKSDPRVFLPHHQSICKNS